MKTRTQAMKLGLGALALGVGVAVQAAAPVIQSIEMVGANPRLGIQSDVGSTNEIQYAADLSQTNWTVLTNLVVAESPYWFVDVADPPASQRFYRVVAFPTAPTDMALIPAGSFTMGNTFLPSEGYSDELPLHTVYVSAFYMDKYEVTKSLWDTVKAYNGGNGYSYENAGLGKATTHPVQTVNWRDCVKWCNARSEKEGLTPCYYNEAGLTTVYKTGTGTPYPNWNVNGYRLPTAAEWEKAARGGASGHRFPWSDADTITHSRANYYSSSSYAYDTSPTRGYHPNFNTGGYPYTSPVGYFAANGYGLYDMAGNVFEWCWDWYDGSWYSNAGATQNDTRGPTGPLSLRVLRGGSWNSDAFPSRCALRVGNYPDGAFFTLGFRCVRGL